jgi:hypothetical protein
MKNEKKRMSALIAGLLLFSILFTLSGCSAKKSSTVNMSSNVSKSSAVSQTSSVSESSDVLVKSSDGSVSISVPSGWNTKDTSIWPTAVIAVSDGASYQYAIVIKRPKSELAAGTKISDYITSIKPYYSALLTNPVWGENSNVQIGSLSGLKVQLKGTGKVSKADLVYWINVIEDSSNFYQVTGWTKASEADALKKWHRATESNGSSMFFYVCYTH